MKSWWTFLTYLKWLSPVAVFFAGNLVLSNQGRMVLVAWVGSTQARTVVGEGFIVEDVGVDVEEDGSWKDDVDVEETAVEDVEVVPHCGTRRGGMMWTTDDANRRNERCVFFCDPQPSSTRPWRFCRF